MIEEQYYLGIKGEKNSEVLEDCHVSCMIQLGGCLIIADNHTKQPTIKLFSQHYKELDTYDEFEKSTIKDLTKIKDNRFAVLQEIRGWFSTECRIIIMEVTPDEKLKKLTLCFSMKFPWAWSGITSIYFANDLLFLAVKDSEPGIQIYELEEGEQVHKIQSGKKTFQGSPTKIFVDDHYKMIVSDSEKRELICFDYAPASRKVKNISKQKLHVLAIEPLPDGTILLVTAGNTSLVKLYPALGMVKTNFFDTKSDPVAIAYNQTTQRLFVAVKEPSFLGKIKFGWLNQKYKILTYSFKICRNTDTSIQIS